jgi:uncharacterized membrane protein YfcA
MSYLLIGIISYLAFLLSVACGGGAGMLILPALQTVLPATEAPGALTVGTFASSLSRLSVFWRQIRWELVRAFLPAGLLGAVLGVWLMSRLDPIAVELCSASFLLSNLPALLARPGHDPPPLSKNWVPLIGLAAGFVSGLTGAVGLLFNGFYLRLGMTKEEIVATRAANEIALHLLKLLLYLRFGMISRAGLLCGILVALAAWGSARSAKPVLARMPERLFRKVGYAAMVFAGAGMLTLSLRRLQFNAGFESDSVTAHLLWKKSLMTLELEWDDGQLQIEHPLPLSELSPELQNQLSGLESAELIQVWSLSGSYRELIWREKGTWKERRLTP